MTEKYCVHIGVDVGGTNTDAVVMCKGQVMGFAKRPTSKHVTDGICRAVTAALLNCHDSRPEDKGPCQLEVMRIHIGTTHFVNAVAQKQDLAPVAVIRLCAPASTSLPPFSNFPEDLQRVVAGPVFMVAGGYYFDGNQEINPLDRQEISSAINSIKSAGIRNIVVSGIFSPVNNAQELQVGRWLKEIYPEATFTLSSTIAQLNMLLRENSAVINESLKPLAQKTIAGIRTALNQLNLNCPFFLTQNDGTLLSAEKAKELPVFTFASGPTNSMRGAAFLSGVKHGVVVDIGGTTTDAGMLIKGFPRQASSKVSICRVQTNFQMPDTVSFALGGGSIVRFVQGQEQKVMIGPKSVGFNILREAIVFGGHTLTATDVAVAANIADVGTFQHQLTAHYVPEVLVKSAIEKIQSMLENVIDSIKTSEEEVPVILVGGGTVLIDKKWKPPGCSEVLRPPHYDVANAVGAALSQVSGSIDVTKNLTNVSRDSAVASAKQQAIDMATAEGADPETIQIVKLEDIPLTYIPGDVTRIMVKAVGDLMWETNTLGVMWHPQHAKHDQQASEDDTPHEHVEHMDVDEESVIPKEETPNIDPTSGEWFLSVHDIKSLEIGAGILGCGGGGSPLLGKLRAVSLLKEGKKIRVINPERFCRLSNPEDIVVSKGFMGAPTVGVETLFNIVETTGAVQAIEDILTQDKYANGKIENEEQHDIHTENGTKYIKNYKPKVKTSLNASNKDRKIKALMGVEVGGSNCLTPLYVGAELDIPVLDCDLMGRAFPELQMITTAINGYPLVPYALSDLKNRQYVCLESGSPKHLEDSFRKICVEFGCRSGISMGSMSAKSLPGNVVSYSTSRAWRLGQAVLHARRQKTSPVAAILDFEGGILLCYAKMITTAINVYPLVPFALSDLKNRQYVCLESGSPKHLEDSFRKICVEFGCTCGSGMGSMSAKSLPGNVVFYSTSRAWRLGQAVLHARRHKTSPVSAILDFEGGILLCTAKICDVKRKTEGGFARGQMKLEGIGEFCDTSYSVEFQNENLVAKNLTSKKTLASVPDLITIVDQDTGEPIPTDEVRYGLRIAVLALPAPPILTTPQALAVVGPKAFGYESVEYVPVGEYVEHKPVPPP